MHEAERALEHPFIGLLQTNLFIERENLVGGREFLVGAGQEAVDSSPVNRVWLEFLHATPNSGTRLLCQTFSRKASLRERRNLNSFGVKAV
jgi:hypothetical protein